MMTAIWLISIGLLGGLLASSLGIGGGVIFVPVLAIGLGLGQVVAQGTSLAVIVPTAIIGTYGHARFGRVDWRTALPVSVGGVIGAILGAQLALAADPIVLRRMFAGLLAVLAARLVLGELAAQRRVKGG